MAEQQAWLVNGRRYDCQDCGGTGVCSACGGLGVDGVLHDDNTYEERDCLACEGGDCYACGGHGEFECYQGQLLNLDHPALR